MINRHKTTHSLKLSTKFVLSVAGLAMAGCASIAPANQTSPATASKSDVSRADELFAMFDENGDGYLTRAEMNRSMTLAMNYEPNPNLMMGLDAGKTPKKKVSRKMTPKELKQSIDAAFLKDSDLDDRLSSQEFKKLVVERRPDEPDPFAAFL